MGRSRGENVQFHFVLPGRPQIAFKPAHRLRLHRIRRDGRDMGVVALAAFKTPDIETLGTMRDPRQRHARLALRAARPLNRGKRRAERVRMRFKHLMHPCVKGGSPKNSQLPMDAGTGR